MSISNSLSKIIEKSRERMAGEGYEQENQSSQEVKRHEREACHKQARVRLSHRRGRKFHH